MITLNKHQISASVKDRYANIVYCFDFENTNEYNGSCELKFEITIDPNAFISKFFANIDGELFIGKTKEKERASKEYVSAKEKDENAILISVPHSNIANLFEIKTNIDSKSKIVLKIEIEQYLQKTFGSNKLSIQILRNFKKYNIKQINNIPFELNIQDQSGVYDIKVGNDDIMIDEEIMDKMQKECQIKGKIMNKSSINELTLTYKVKGELEASHILFDDKSNTFCHIISDIIINDNILIPRRVIFVIDKSYSMNGSKWRKTISSAIMAIKQLRNGFDRFAIILFDNNMEILPYSTLERTNDVSVSDAIKLLQNAKIGGSTNINDSLLKAIDLIKTDIISSNNEYNFFINQIILITDGEPNSGENDTKKIISNISNANDLSKIDKYNKKISIFAFGVGQNENDSGWIKDLNHSFLKILSINNNAFYQRIKQISAHTQLNQIFTILSKPVLSNIHIKYKNNNITDLTNTKFNTLYYGNDLIICGKMQNKENISFIVSAITAKTIKEKPITVTKEIKINIHHCNNINNNIQRIYAYLKLKQFAKNKLIHKDMIEMDDDEKKEESKVPLSLSLKFVTPWTSMIVVKQKQQNVILIPKQIVQHQQRSLLSTDVDCCYFDDIEEEQDIGDYSQSTSISNRVWGYTFNRNDAQGFKQYAQSVVSADAQQKAEHLKRNIENIKGQRVKYSRDRRKRAAELEKKLQNNDEGKQDDNRQIIIQYFLDESSSLRSQRTAKQKTKASDFKIIKVIGKGCFGEVRIVRKKENKKIYAMKTILKKMMVTKDNVSGNGLMKDTNNEWIVNLYYAFQYDIYLYLVMEFCVGGDLMSLLIKKDILSESDTVFYMSELAAAINCVHELGYVYRDLKPDKILIANDGHIKVTDIGLSNSFESSNDMSLEKWQQFVATLNQEDEKEIKGKRDRKRRYSVIGTPDYIAIEVLYKKGYDNKVDWWSMGVIMFECFVGYSPFNDSDPLGTCTKIVRYEKYLKIPTDIKLTKKSVDLMKALVCPVHRRICWQKIKAHLWFKKVNWNDLKSHKPPFIPKNV